MSDDANSSFTQSAARKKEYKHLLEVGGEAANNVDNKTIAENFIALRDLVTESNKLARQGQLADRIGQSAEVVLDAQVSEFSIDRTNFHFYRHNDDDNIPQQIEWIFFLSVFSLIRFANCPPNWCAQRYKRSKTMNSLMKHLLLHW